MTLVAGGEKSFIAKNAMQNRPTARTPFGMTDGSLGRDPLCSWMDQDWERPVVGRGSP